MFKCRFCQSELQHIFVDLGMSPLSNSYVAMEDINKKENFYPLKVYVCSRCFLVQLPEHASSQEIFNEEYAYFSSYSTSWLEHAKSYTEMMVERFNFNHNSLVVELGSNDGYLLQYFKAQDIPVLGIEPAGNVAQAAAAKDIPTLVKFFNSKTAQEMVKQGHTADLLMGINFLAQIPDLNDFLAGIKLVLKPNGVITIEFPHLLQLIQQNQFDTIYHEHYSYFSFTTLEKIFNPHGLVMFDVEELSTHGGSLRIFAKHKDNRQYEVTDRVSKLKKTEIEASLDSLTAYQQFAEQVKATKRNILQFLIEQKSRDKAIAGYGAPAKANTLLNYCGIGTDFIDYTVDRNPHKQGTLLPGSRIPVFSPDKIYQTQPDYLVIMPWNLKTEIGEQMKAIRDWGGKFATLIPQVDVF